LKRKKGQPSSRGASTLAVSSDPQSAVDDIPATNQPQEPTFAIAIFHTSTSNISKKL